MKNLFYKKKIWTLLLSVAGFLFTQILPAQNSGLQNCILTVTGTGKTTGDIVAMTIYNPTDKEVKGGLGPYYIPSGGNFQPYIVPTIKEISVPGGQTIHFKLQGFCADITKPPVPVNENFPPIINWIHIKENAPVDIEPYRSNINPDTNPEQAAPILLKAIEDISKAYDKLKTEGKINTPFSSNPEKEREAVIQQTFWIYAADTRKKPYTKDQFSNRTYEQYEEKTNIKPITLPPDKKQQLDKGIDDFWNTFEAVGIQAKVLENTTTPTPEKDKIITPVSVPKEKLCECGECRLVDGQRIEIYFERNREPFTGDSIPWNINQIIIDRPEVYSTCVPMECLPKREFEMRITITYKDKKFSGPTPVWKVFDFMTESPVMEHQGEMLIEFRYKCFCEGKFCAEGMTSRKINFIEKNDCCDKIRAKNNGQLQFNFKGGNAVISGNNFSVYSKDCGDQVFNFGFNLEAIFCNLTDDQVFGELIKMSQASLSKGNLTEFYSSADLSMGGVSTDPNMSKFYSFGFSKKVNDKEMSIFISIEKDKCVFDLSLFCNGKIYETTAPPYLSPAQLIAMANNLGVPTSNQSWSNAMTILSHLARADEHGQGAAYKQALNNFLTKIMNQATMLMNNPQNAALTGYLTALKIAAANCAATGNFKLLDDVMTKMIPILNRMN